MTISAPASRNVGACPAAADQIVVTHCLKEDSVLGQSGFSVRAASTSDPELLGWAHRHLEPYELPLEMQRGTVIVSQAPRRLALLPAPGDRVALVHSSYLPGDSCQPPRPHSFITPVLIYSYLDALSAAAAWHAPGWQRHPIDRGVSKVLDPLDGVPRGTLVHEQAVTDLLSGTTAPADQSTSSVLFPSRMEGDPESRRRCVRAALHGFLRTFEPGAERGRVCVLAEPGTVALLAYAVARLLPPSLAETFWFSTYEPPQGSFREHRRARLVGSFTLRPIDRGESDSLRRGGYLVDTLRTPPSCGPELALNAADWPLEELLDLATAGDWGAVDQIRAAWTATPPGPSPASVAEALRNVGLRSGPPGGVTPAVAPNQRPDLAGPWGLSEQGGAAPPPAECPDEPELTGPFLDAVRRAKAAAPERPRPREADPVRSERVIRPVRQAVRTTPTPGRPRKDSASHGPTSRALDRVLFFLLGALLTLAIETALFAATGWTMTRANPPAPPIETARESPREATIGDGAEVPAQGGDSSDVRNVKPEGKTATR